MSEALNQALTLLAVGMISVFAVLALVVLTGRILIRLTNRMGIDEVASKKSSAAKSGKNTDKVAPAHLAVMSAVVDHLTGGNGRISRVRKVDKED
ncbi:MAG: hypothetical protein GYB31_12535 [Bacteroidetes bacterium]|nr:hypothetical protein [Bacteroidota bacterium]